MKKVLLIILYFSAAVFAQIAEELNNKFSLAQSYEQTGDYKLAQQLYEDLYKADSANSLYINSLNRVYLQLKNYAASVNLLEKRIKEQPLDISAYGMLGSTYYLMGNEQKAFEVWDEPFNNLKPDPIFYRVIADYVVERRAFEKAIELYEHGKALSKDKVIFSYDLARLYSLTMQFAKATNEYCFIITQNPDELQSVEARILQYLNKPGALQPTISTVEKWSNDGNLGLMYLLARLYTASERYENAFEIYASIDERTNKQGREILRFASMLYREGEYSLAADAYKKIIEELPASPFIPQAQLGFAKTLEAKLFDDYEKQLPLWKPYFPITKYESPQVEIVLDAFKRVADTYKQSETAYEATLRIGMINFYMQLKYDKAKNLFLQIINEAPLAKSAPRADIELGNLSLLKGNLTEAENFYSNILTLHRISSDERNTAIYKLARVYFYKKDFEKSKELLSKILYNLKDEFANDALELSLLLNTMGGDSVNLSAFADAEFLLAQQHYNEAAIIYKNLSENPQLFVLHSIAGLRNAEMQLALNNFPEAMYLLQSIIEEGKKNIYADKALYLLGGIYQYGIGDENEAIKIYEDLLAEYPKSIYIDEARERILYLKENPS